MSRSNLIKLLQSPSTNTKQLKQLHAQLLLKTPPLKSSFYLCNSMLLAYANSTNPTDAFSFFITQMREHVPNKFTFQFLLKACSKLRRVPVIAQVHLMVFKLGFSGFSSVMNSVLHCYVLCGRIREEGKVLFDEMPDRDVVSYNCLINGYAEVGDMSSAFQLFKKVECPSVVTWTAMVVGFCSNGDVMSGKRVFEEMPERDLVSWNAMISGYVKNRVPVEALQLFCQMQAENFKPNRVTISTILSACASLGALDTGKWIHVFIKKNGFLLDSFLGCALIDMYLKCGVVELALEVFRHLKEKNTCTWNALVNGLALNGHVKQVLDVFNEMRIDRSVRPDEVTFVGVLLACSHGGFIEEGRKHFYSTMKEYGITFMLEHYACMVDLLARGGMLEEAQDIIKGMHIAPDMVVWRALLGGCRIHKNVELAEQIISNMETPGSGDYVLLSNLYSSLRRWEDVEKVRDIMKEKGIEKMPGCSSIQIDNMIHEFISGDKSHPRYVVICEKLAVVEKRINADGYKAETSVILYDIDEEEKEQSLGHHSEKLAIGEIVVRDRIRFHDFKDGACSCNDYW